MWSNHGRKSLRLAGLQKKNQCATHTHTQARTAACPKGSLFGRHGVHYVVIWVYSTCMLVCVCVGMCTNKHGNASRTGAWEPGLLPPQAAVGLRLMPIYIVAYFRAQWPMASSLPVSWPSAHVRLPLF